MADKISTEALKCGVYIHNWYDHLTISTPLIITEKELYLGVQILDEFLAIADE